jgi:hypothetical protein
MSTIDQKATSLIQMSRLNKESVKRRDQLMVSPEVLAVQAGFNVRGVAMSEDEYWGQEAVQAHIYGISLAYESGDYVPPLVVQFRQEDQKAVIRDGHHRYKAILMAVDRGAEIKFVNVIEFKGDEKKQQLLMLKSSNSLSLSPVERAEIYHRLYTWGNDADEIAQEVNMSVGHVYQYLKLYDLPLEKKKLIQLGKLSVNAALNEAKGPKKFAPPKKAVKAVLDIVTSSVVSEEGDSVTVQIPKELWQQLIKPTE